MANPVKTRVTAAVEVVAAWGCDGEWLEQGGSDNSQVAVLRSASGFVVFEESEDYTGHGCQCGSSASEFPTLADALRLGVTEHDIPHLTWASGYAPAPAPKPVANGQQNGHPPGKGKGGKGKKHRGKRR